jgi:hypothetical protein
MSDSELSKLNSLAIIQQSFPNDDLKLFETTYNNNISGVGGNHLAHAANATPSFSGTTPTTGSKSALFSHFKSPSSLNKNNSIKLHNNTSSSKYSLSLLGTPLLLAHTASRAQSIDKLAKVKLN